MVVYGAMRGVRAPMEYHGTLGNGARRELLDT
jgi:hypothetical protein